MRQARANDEPTRLPALCLVDRLRGGELNGFPEVWGFAREGRALVVVSTLSPLGLLMQKRSGNPIKQDKDAAHRTGEIWRPKGAGIRCVEREE